MSKTLLFSTTAALGLVVFAVFAYATEPTNPVVKPAPTAIAVTPTPAPHCQVPCGIYGDEMRFEGMLEDTATIAKAIAQIEEFAGGLGEGAPTAKGLNQTIRWVNNKESHAQNIQDVMGEYFFAQRIKSDHKDYTAQLATAHKIIVCAMKCKQDASPATAEALKAAVLDFYRAYEGKEPKFHEDEK
jgi:nickel superoxide dismutase